jgi:beta-lactamase class A
MGGSLAGGLTLAEGPGGMAEGQVDAALQARVDGAVARACQQGRPTPLAPAQVAVTLLDLSRPGAPRWAAHRGDQPIYPASVVKLFYLVASHRWLEDGRIEDSAELRRAMQDMIVDSSNEATHYVLDVLTGTTSGPELTPDALRSWQEQRNAVNRYFAGLGYHGINCNKKPWCEGPYGRETQAIRAFEPKRNLLTTDATARLMAEVALGRAVTPKRCDEMKALLARDPKAAPRPDDQTTGFVAGGLPTGAKLWSKAGWTSQTRHDCALVELPDGGRWVVVIFTEGHAQDEGLLPGLARDLLAPRP